MKDPLHFDYLDGWRGLAIAFLLIGHFFPIPGINLGRIGVDLFFVLSGLLMSRLLFVKSTALPLFYKRRISRVFPTFFGFMLLLMLVDFFRLIPIDWLEVSTAAFFVNNYFLPHMGHMSMSFGHIWSLSVEEQSYVLLSLVALCVRRGWCRAPQALLVFIAVSIAASLIYWRIYNVGKIEFGASYHTEIAGYGIFVSAFFLLFFESRTIPRLPTICYPLLGLIAMMLCWWSVPFPITTIFGVGAMGLLVNLLPAAPTLIKQILSFYPLRKLGLWSFSIYIWQQPFYMEHYHHGMPSWLAASLALAAGICSYYLLEKPVRNYLNTHWAKANHKASGSAGLRTTTNAQ